MKSVAKKKKRKTVSSCDEPKIHSEHSLHGREKVTVLEELQGACVELEEAIDAAQLTLVDARHPLASSREAVRRVVGYAHRLSFTTYAPPGFVPGKDALGLYKPPAPQDAQLRASKLHAFQREYIKKRKEEERKEAYGLTAPAKQPTETENLEDILRKMPPMPAGWKPGDPIPSISAPIPAAEPKKEQPKPVSAAFDFALNPEMEIVFGASESEEEDSSDESD